MGLAIRWNKPLRRKPPTPIFHPATQCAGLDRKKRNVIGSDLNHLFGTWDEAEAHQVLESIRSCEQIDEEFRT